MMLIFHCQQCLLRSMGDELQYQAVQNSGATLWRTVWLAAELCITSASQLHVSQETMISFCPSRWGGCLLGSTILYTKSGKLAVGETLPKA